MFNDYVWKNYLNSGGRETADMFRRNLEECFTEEYAESIVKLKSAYCPAKWSAEESKQQLLDAYEDFNEPLLEDGEYCIETAMKALYDVLVGDSEASAKQVFDAFSSSIDYFSVFLAAELRGLFVPYHFKYNYNILERIAKVFDIDLPEMPKKKDYEGRFYHYGRICEALIDFRDEHGMTHYELCAFLYDFAPKYVGGYDSYIIKDLPEAKSAFFIGGSQNDRLYKGEDPVRLWQCNPDTKAGDMIVMYLRTPVSAVDSVWRSVSVGFNDPFFYYYHCTYISCGVPIKRISLKELQEDEIFSNVPIVRKNMQGINGVELLPSQYNHLMDMAKTDVPRLEFEVAMPDGSFALEKDVENKLIKPLLANLGYAEEDCIQQLYLEVGNHNYALIPDFSIMPNLSKGHQSAYYVIEAKLSIPSEAKLEEVKGQARSYARQLNAKYSVIASIEKIWVSSVADDYTDVIFEATWGELNTPDTFSRLNKLLGKK